MIFSEEALILMLPTAAPFQGAEQPDFLSAEETANVMTSKPSAAAHMAVDSWGAFPFSVVLVPAPFASLAD